MPLGAISVCDVGEFIIDDSRKSNILPLSSILKKKLLFACYDYKELNLQYLVLLLVNNHRMLAA
jgi:hypothetical protein